MSILDGHPYTRPLVYVERFVLDVLGNGNISEYFHWDSDIL